MAHLAPKHYWYSKFSRYNTGKRKVTCKLHTDARTQIKKFLKPETYKVCSDLKVVQELPDRPGPEAEHGVEARTDELRVDLLRVLAACGKADRCTYHEARHAGNGREPHVGDLVDDQVGE